MVHPYRFFCLGAALQTQAQQGAGLGGVLHAVRLSGHTRLQQRPFVGRHHECSHVACRRWLHACRGQRGGQVARWKQIRWPTPGGWRRHRAWIRGQWSRGDSPARTDCRQAASGRLHPCSQGVCRIVRSGHQLAALGELLHHSLDGGNRQLGFAPGKWWYRTPWAPAPGSAVL